MGKRARFLRLPEPLVRSGAGLLGRLGVTALGASHLSIDRVARLALDENPFQSTRIRRELGWQPEHRHGDALTRTGRDLLNQPT